MDTKICLIIIFNHKFNRNIKLLENLYKDRFHHICYLVPFLTEEEKKEFPREKVIPVFESSYRFQNYIPQGLSDFYEENYTHYFFIGDDLILAPHINETNLLEMLSIQHGESYTTEAVKLNERYLWYYSRIYHTKKLFEKTHYVNFKSEIRNAVEAFKLVEQYGDTDFDTCEFERFRKQPVFSKAYIKEFVYYLSDKKKKMPYPLYGGYSDFIVVDKESIHGFAHYCGVFAAMDVFVEIAIPTAMKLCCKQLKTGVDLSHKSGILRENERINLEKDYQCNFKKLMEQWPKDYLYLHPIKLSKWK